MAEELDEVPPEDFVAARDALARRLTAAGDRDGARAVKQRRRPTVPAWIAGQVHRHHPDAVEALRAASRALADAQRAAVTGGDRDAVRTATRDHREATAALARAVDGILAGEGRPGHHREEAVRTIEAEILAEVAPGIFGLPDDLVAEDAGLPTGEVEEGVEAVPPEAAIRPAEPGEELTLGEARAAAEPAVITLVAERAGTVVGVATGGPLRIGRWPAPAGALELFVEVGAGDRGHGIGGRLVEALADAAADGGRHELVAVLDEADEVALRFLAAHGFETLGRLPGIDEALDLVLLRRRLDAPQSAPTRRAPRSVR